MFSQVSELPHLAVPVAEEAGSGSSALYFILLLVLLAVLMGVFLFLYTRSQKQDDEQTSAAYPETSMTETAAVAVAAAAPVEPDDLKKIEGIGPKIAGLLQAAGLNTFAQLADVDVDKLQQILDEAQVRIAKPDTWPEQAKLAAAGDWETLEKLQDSLSGGKRV